MLSKHLYISNPRNERALPLTTLQTDKTKTSNTSSFNYFYSTRLLYDILEKVHTDTEQKLKITWHIDKAIKEKYCFTLIEINIHTYIVIFLYYA